MARGRRNNFNQNNNDTTTSTNRPPKNVTPPKTISVRSDSSSGDEVSSSGSELESDEEDDDYDDDDDDRSSGTETSNDMPQLVGRDESSHSSHSTDSNSMPDLSKRLSREAAARKKKKDAAASATPTSNKANKKKPKKKKKKSKDVLQTQEEIDAALRAAEEEKRRAAEKLLKDNRDMAFARYRKLADKVSQKVGVYTSDHIPFFDKPEGFNVSTETQALDGLFNLTHEGEPLWCLLDDASSCQILKAALKSTESLSFFETHASQVLEAFSSTNKVRQEDITVLLTAKLTFNAKSVSKLLSNLENDRGIPFNNNTAKTLSSTCKIKIESKSDKQLVLKDTHECLGKVAKKKIIEAVNQAVKDFMKAKAKQSRTSSSPSGKIIGNSSVDANGVVDTKEEEEPDETNEEMERKALEEMERKLAAMSIQGQKITSTYQWYTELLKEFETKAPKNNGGFDQYDEEDEAKSNDGGENNDAVSKAAALSKKKTLSSDQLVEALTSCETEDALDDIETGIDLLKWDSMSPWIIDITEHAHKFFRRHIKKDRSLCERVIRRLMMLSTGRWPYVLCKHLRSQGRTNFGKKINLYETKIDSASRIIWEVALAFSPRRSSNGNNVCEQVVRVWDIVLDHDNLSRAIDQTIERIEKSHKRGEDCAIWAEIDKKAQDPSRNEAEGAPNSDDGIRVPKYFAMSQEVAVSGTGRDEAPKDKSKHFDPASDDPRQYTLLKFYELNEGAVKMLLDGKDNMDLPFTPGPKEHEIIHHRPETPKSLLLMGRSGTGKTTCLVFRMWAQYHEYRQQGARPRQMFLTKNEVLCREVQRSFNNMGRAWRKRIKTNDPAAIEPDWSTITDAEKPKFLTSSEWLEALDVELPGEHFFTQFELKKRVDTRKEKDSVTKGIEDYLTGRDVDEIVSSEGREEMDFPKFLKLWKRKLRSSRSALNEAIVWREIKSFIKGSIVSLHINDNEDRSAQDRYLSLEEYLALGKKESRLDKTQRREAYEIFLKYEKLKKEGSFYDEGDLVHSIASRVSRLSRRDIEALAMQGVSLLPVDSLFVDEVQDFTQSELYVLAMLCRDPNNLFLAGDTAQSISQGVDFRFTDVRQIFFDHFGGAQPDLLQLTHNYRSHAGVLRLAACVVELMYHFFGNSLDRLPPDLGLFNGPKPVILNVTSTEDLVLMLDGSKRETSRIEFGAHQVVIVRSEEAKKTLPDEFGVDPDWVMTVQESKGLEFDDVLLYNFFSDSPAEDLWRIVSNYTEDDIKAYYADATVAGSGVRKYDWDSPLLNDTRHLDFDVNSHKILEVELKMLYTAITRARVNVFVAETDSELSRPMFNYFQRRAVVDVVNKEGGLSSVRVFGAKDTIEDWKNRGEYYLQNAEGARQISCLRLAAKCFDKAGDTKRMNQTLAFLSFTEIENVDQKKLTKDTKKQLQFKEKLYNITEQLLEARDVGFLNKAALCLLKTKEHEEYTARMFELYARLSYAKRISEDDSLTPPVAPTSHEEKYFSYAGKLFAKVHESESEGRFVLAVDCFRNYLCAGMYDEAADMINSGNLVRNNKEFQRIYQLCIPSAETMHDPTATFRKDFQRKKCVKLIEAVKSAAISVGN